MSNELLGTLNFLDPIIEPEDSWTKLYNWITTAGKYILLFSTVIVIGVFGMRFYYDRVNNDLSIEINDKIEYYLSTEDVQKSEKLYRSTISYVNDLKYIRDNSKSYGDEVNVVINSIPSDIKVRSFSFSQGVYSLNVESETTESVEKYTASINRNPLFKNANSAVIKDGGENSITKSNITFYSAQIYGAEE